jgi:hypothetical protein
MFAVLPPLRQAYLVSGAYAGSTLWRHSAELRDALLSKLILGQGSLASTVMSLRLWAACQRCQNLMLLFAKVSIRATPVQSVCVKRCRCHSEPYASLRTLIDTIGVTLFWRRGSQARRPAGPVESSRAQKVESHRATERGSRWMT